MIKKPIKEHKKLALIFTTTVVVLVLCCNATPSTAETETGTGDTERFFDPFKRTKHGPPLKNITHKVGAKWLFDWIKDPKKYDPKSKMPNLQLEDDEVKSIMAYLASIADADKDLPKAKWDAFITKPESELTDEEYDTIDKLMFQGKGVWGVARCNICHGQKGTGGYVSVAPELGSVNAKIKRDWLYNWLKNPRDYYPDTMMPQFRFPEEELRALVEYILRDYDFLPEEDDEEEEEESSEEEDKEAAPAVTYSNDPSVIANGKNAITVSRCAVCHDIEGIDEVLPVAEKEPTPTKGFAKLAYEVRCLTCHNIRGEGGTYAPELTHAGSKLQGDWLAHFIKQPDIIRPISQQMPKLYLSAEEADTAKDYIKKHLIDEEMPTDLFTETTPNEAQAEAGKEFFFNYGCNACHALGALGGVIGPNLDKSGDRLEPNYMFWHLKDPGHAGADTPEPRYNLTDEDITSLVHFLMTHTKKGNS